jgi:hypothetical protein
MARATPNRMSVHQFRERGYLHEVNRLVLHPLGLALEVILEECPFCGEREENSDDCGMCSDSGLVERLGAIWDFRDHPEGIYYGEDLLSPEKAQAVYDETVARRDERVAALGYLIQPVPGVRALHITENSHAATPAD